MTTGRFSERHPSEQSMPNTILQEDGRVTCKHGVTIGFACNECSVRAGRTIGVKV